jgi:hypothetical protein
MEEPNRNDTAEQKPRNEEYKQEAEKLLKLHRQDKLLAPSMFLKILEVYLLFVAVVGGIGVLAFYSHHEAILTFVLIAEGALVLAAPIAVIRYLLVNFRKKPTIEKTMSDKRNLLVRIAESSFGMSLLRLFNNRIFRILNLLFNCGAAVYMITDAIMRFPLQPRLSLAIIVVYIVLPLALFTIEIVRSLENTLRERLDVVWKFNEINNRAINSINGAILGVLEMLKDVNTTATTAVSIAGNSIKFIDDTEPSHMEMHNSTNAALKALHHTLEIMANTFMTKPDQVGNLPEEEDEPRTD